jgi:trigger factor
MDIGNYPQESGNHLMAKKKKADQEQASEDQAGKEAKTTQVTVQDVGPCKKKVTVEIPESKVKESLGKKYEELRKDAVLPGFRKGRAPLRLLEKRYGTDVTKQAKLELIIDASQEAMKEHKIESLADPDIDHEKVEVPASGPMKFEFEVTVRPTFELPELEGLELEKPVIEVTDAKVDQEVEALCKRAGLWTPKDGAVAADDQVIADVAVNVEGAAEHEKHDNIEIYVRKTGFVGGVPVEDLDKLLIKAKVGDEKKTTVEVPATFFNEQYRGKKVNVQITIREVKELKPAELTDEFLNRFGLESVESLKDSIRKNLEGHCEQEARAAMTDQIYHYLDEKINLELPAEVVAGQSANIMQRQYANLITRGVPKEEVEQQMEQLRASSEEQAVDQLKQYFIMEKAAEKYEINVTDEEINGYIAQVAAQRGRRPEKMRDEMMRDGSLAHFTMQYKEQKFVDKIIEKAKITEVAPEKATKAAKARAAKADKHKRPVRAMSKKAKEKE